MGISPQTTSGLRGSAKSSHIPQTAVMASKKRPLDLDEHFVPLKKSKQTQLLQDKVKVSFTRLQERISSIEDYLSPIVRTLFGLMATDVLENSTFPERHLISLSLPFSVAQRSPEPLTDNDTKALCLLFEYANDSREAARENYSKYLDYCKEPPPPSDYAEPAVWAAWQRRSGAILCGRPPTCRGLALTIMHDVFRKFTLRAEKPVPALQENYRFIAAAEALCETMGQEFKTEQDRTDAFHACVTAAFPAGWVEQFIVRAPSQVHHGRVDGAYMLDNTVALLREDKCEVGEGHDGYMQNARAYQIFAQGHIEKRTRQAGHGVPTFLTVIQGYQISVSGGYNDGQSTLVEYLTPIYPMLGNCGHAMREKIASLLYASFTAVKEVASLRGSTLNSDDFPAGTPRLYPSFQLRDPSVVVPLRFIAAVASPNGRPRLFHAKYILGTTHQKALVKLIEQPVERPRLYGTSVHAYLSDRKKAPVLYGVQSLEGAPTAIVMESLEPASSATGDAGWLHLFDLAGRIRHGAITTSAANELCNQIQGELDSILNLLKSNQLVHGDLRPNNIMVKVDQHNRLDGENWLKIVDFDWGGEDGKVEYPLAMNPQVEWAGKSGEPIVAACDRRQVEITMAFVFPSHMNTP